MYLFLLSDSDNLNFLFTIIIYRDRSEGKKKTKRKDTYDSLSYRISRNKRWNVHNDNHVAIKSS